MNKSILQEKSFLFAIQIVKLNHELFDRKSTYPLNRQLLRSGTAIGALIREAQNAESLKDFIHKLAIAQKECDETQYWLELLYESKLLEENRFLLLHSNANELLKMLRSAIVTSKKKLATHKGPSNQHV